MESEYQMGNTKIFMRESQKQKLDTHLHQTILSQIIVIQRWYRTVHQRRNFLNFRAMVIKIQVRAVCCIFFFFFFTNQFNIKFNIISFVRDTIKDTFLFFPESYLQSMSLIFLQNNEPLHVTVVQDSQIKCSIKHEKR